MLNYKKGKKERIVEIIAYQVAYFSFYVLQTKQWETHNSTLDDRRKYVAFRYRQSADVHTTGKDV